MSHEADDPRTIVAASVEYWRSLVQRLAGASAVTSVEEVDTALPWTNLSVEPVNPRAASIDLLLTPHEMILHLGRHGCRWELDDGALDTAFAERVIDAAIAGRAEELVGTIRFAVRVTFRDGTVEENVRLDGFLAPTRRWMRREPWTRFKPYDVE
ncbi:hypothetical protein ITJ66_01445 [Plantibacter sp. VKM Ac-2885]|uniref:hypothetical protein n=1 Tax=Plantibacter sp. VKM Ac-2885 TaxID=2783828 RepID=UPI00188D776E|nr:hypothetical protein [Plantibacter sp. VKM Ac-2885]MBF4511133.1 hypothetical protein [Plantibacter sp. VKM Ac-2885]